MKKYIMTERGLMSKDYPGFHTPFPTGTIGQTYLESEIEFVDQVEWDVSGWQDAKHGETQVAICCNIRTIARLRAPQVNNEKMAVIIDLMDSSDLTPIEVIEYLTRNNLKS